MPTNQIIQLHGWEIFFDHLNQNLFIYAGLLLLCALLARTRGFWVMPSLYLIGVTIGFLFRDVDGFLGIISMLLLLLLWMPWFYTYDITFCEQPLNTLCNILQMLGYLGGGYLLNFIILCVITFVVRRHVNKKRVSKDA
jgi:hypothetical protein